jgi:UDP-N-acetylmuramate--alanine ligase
MNNKIKTVYFLGIGGIGMSALARFFKKQGADVHGYDRTATPLTAQLEKEGMFIHYNENISAIPSGPDLVVYTPAIPCDNKEYLYFINNGFELKKRARVLGELSKDYFTVAVAGTHGKTSISSMAAHMLKAAGKNLTALIGGILKNYGSNFIISDKTDILLVEADEYDRSFLQLHPDISVISSMDADHLDIYGNRDELKNNFIQFAQKLNQNGTLIHHQSLNELKGINRKHITYSAREEAQCSAKNIRIENGSFVFDLQYQSQSINNITLSVPGLHYIENALAAAAIGFETGLTTQQIKTGLESFSGVQRRFDYIIKTGNRIFIDDYAHHPRELKVTIEAVKSLYPHKKITGIFQPHLYSRTNDFAEEFAGALDGLDEIILLDIYPAREEPIPGVTSEIIFNKMKNNNKTLISKEKLLNHLSNNPPEVLITLGAGDIGLMLENIKEILINE